MGQLKYDWEAIKAMFIAGHTAREIAIIFGCHPQNILNHSKKLGWGALRKQLKSLPPPGSGVFEPKMPKKDGAKTTEVRFEVEPAQPVNKAQSKLDSTVSVERAIKLRSSDNFRDRIISQADKALTTLENAVVNNVYETDRFAEALTKIERIGARAYGYDRESEHPIINIGILGSGAEYEQT